MLNLSQKRAHLIKMVHILKAQIGLDDVEYKEILRERYGVDSSKDLELCDLESFAITLGYVPNNFDKAIKGKATQKQINTIMGIWEEIARDKSAMALRNFCFKIIKKRPLYIATLTLKEAQILITALMKMKKSAKNDLNVF